MKEKDDLISDLKCIADIAHAGGLCGLDAFGVILFLRERPRRSGRGGIAGRPQGRHLLGR